MTNPQYAQTAFIDHTTPTDNDVTVIPVFADDHFGKKGKAINKELGEFLSLNAAFAADFKGEAGKSIALALPKGSSYGKVILLGMGAADQINAGAVNKIATGLSQTLARLNIKSASIIGDQCAKMNQNADEVYAAIAAQICENGYRFDKYKNKLKAEKAPESPKLDFIVKNPKAAQQHFDALSILSEGKMLAQDLGNEPPNVLYPESYALRIKDLLEPLGVEVDIIDVHGMKHLGMHAALAVGESAGAKPCMVVMKYDGRSDADKAKNPNKRPLGYVGKGLTIDTGGYNIKTRSMDLMKLDMCGSASVVGAMYTLAKQQSKANIVSVVGLAENRISESSYLPGAIIDSMAGFTIEIGNTDAEGRLVLADAITYLKQAYNPHIIVDVATLTGACIQAHGHDKAGLFTNSKGLVKAFTRAAEQSGEAIAHDPIEEKHIRAMDGKLADLTNSCKTTDPEIQKAGHITAAAFLQHFAEHGGKTKWAHVDIAGTAIPPSGMASGWGVKLLTSFANDQAEEKAAKPKAPKL